MARDINQAVKSIFPKFRKSMNFAYPVFSMTCVDQTFFTTFGLMDKSVNMYMMNFKKGSQITKEKLHTENKKSLNLLSTLPVVAGDAKDAYHAEQTQQ